MGYDVVDECVCSAVHLHAVVAVIVHPRASQRQRAACGADAVGIVIDVAAADDGCRCVDGHAVAAIDDVETVHCPCHRPGYDHALASLCVQRRRVGVGVVGPGGQSGRVAARQCEGLAYVCHLIGAGVDAGCHAHLVARQCLGRRVLDCAAG